MLAFRDVQDVRPAVGVGDRAEAADDRARRRAQPRPVGGAAGAARRARRRRATPPCSTCGRCRPSSPATCRERSTCRSTAARSGRRPRSSSTRTAPIVLHASSPEEAQEAAWRLWAGRALRPRGLRARAARDRDARDARRRGAAPARRGRTRPCRSSTSASRASATRATSRGLATSRTASCAPPARTRSTRSRPVVTVCESGPRAAIAASVLSREGFDARPVLDGGIADFAEDETVSFRRCGA